MTFVFTAIRHQNLKLLRNRASSVVDFAKRAGLSPAQVSQLTSDNPKGHKVLGEVLARRIEENLGLASGWLDEQHEAADVPDLPEPSDCAGESADGAASAREARTSAGTNARTTAGQRRTHATNSTEGLLNLSGLTPLQVAMLTTAAKLCRADKLRDRQCLELLGDWTTLLE